MVRSLNIHPDRSAITRLGTKSEDDVFLILILNRLHVISIFFVPGTNTRFVTNVVSIMMHERDKMAPHQTKG